MSEVGFKRNGGPDIDWSDPGSILASTEYKDWMGLSISRFPGGKRQVWYSASAIYVDVDIPCHPGPCGMDGEEFEDDYCNYLVDNIYEFRKYWGYGNNLSLEPWTSSRDSRSFSTACSDLTLHLEWLH